MLAVEVTGLTKTYRGPFGRPDHTALRGVDLAIEPGTAFGLIGPNGAGKTTFVKALLGIVHPDGGSVRLLAGDPAEARIRRRVGYLPERLQLPVSWSALQVLASAARLKGAERRPQVLRRRLEEVGLAADAGRPVSAYSKGMRQRLGLACALLGDPELLLLDEPTDGLDPMARVEVRQILARAVARGAAVLLNSHLLSETERACSRIGILVQGRLVRQGELAEMQRSGSRWLLRFEGEVSPERLAAAGFAAAPASRWRFDGDPAALNEALDRARSAGALVVSLEPEARSLEQVLADSVRGEG